MDVRFKTLFIDKKKMFLTHELLPGYKKISRALRSSTRSYDENFQKICLLNFEA